MTEEDAETKEYYLNLQKGKKRVTIIGSILIVIGALFLVLPLMPPFQSLSFLNSGFFFFVDFGLLVFGAFLLISRIVANPQYQKRQSKTIKNITITGRTLEDVNSEILKWVEEQKIFLEEQKDNHFKGI